MSLRIFPLILFGMVCTCTCVSSSAAASPIQIVLNGNPNAIIVTSANPSAAAKEGSRILSDHLFQISGARLAIISEDKLTDDSPANRILVGRSTAVTVLGAKAESLKPGGILIRTFPNTVILLGEDDPLSYDPNGTRYAVTTFLEDVCAVRFLWPGETGKVVPKSDTIEVPEMNLIFNPLLLQRKIRMGGGFSDRMERGGLQLGVSKVEFEKVITEARATKSYDARWSGWHRLGGSLRLTSGHSFGDAWEKWGDTHPDWFAMAPNGSRDQSASPHRARLCVSNQELIKAVALDRIATINETGQKSISIGPNDGGTTSFCVCPDCEALDARTDRKIDLVDFSPGAKRSKFEHVPLTDRYIHFWNGIAARVTAEHPDVWLTADAYSAYSAPPVNAKLHPNIAIRYVGISYLNEEKRHLGLKDWNAWAKSASKIYFRSNLLLAGRRQGTAVLYIHKLAEDFRRIAPNQMIGTDLDSCMNNWSTQGLNYYVMGKLLWNPNLNIEELIDDYCHSGFGKGAEPVKKYFLKLEELTNEIATNKLGVTAPFTPMAIAELRKHLDEADKATKSDKESNQRVAFLLTGLEYTEGYSDIFRINQEWESIGGRLSPEMKERFQIALDLNWENSRDIFYHHPLAVNVSNVAWGSWGYFKRFGWKSPSVD